MNWKAYAVAAVALVAIAAQLPSSGPATASVTVDPFAITVDTYAVAFTPYAQSVINTSRTQSGGLAFSDTDCVVALGTLGADTATDMPLTAALGYLPIPSNIARIAVRGYSQGGGLYCTGTLRVWGFRNQ